MADPTPTPSWDALSVRREFAAERINAVVNHPDVRPWVGGTGVLDLTGLIANPDNVLLMSEGGGLLFQKLDDGLYEVHTQFLPGWRAGHAVRSTRDALRWMFTRTDAVEIVTKVPDGNKGALGLVRLIHGEYMFHRPRAWGGVLGISYYTMTLARWVQHADHLPAIGDWFHDRLAEAKGGVGVHDDDDVHDRYVGATCEMIINGQISKGLTFYARWAVYAGYQVARLVAIDPPVIDTGDALIAIRGKDMDVILTR